MSVRSGTSLEQGARRRSRVVRVVSAVVAVGVTASLAVVGDDVLALDADADVLGTSVTLGATSTTSVCPGPVSLPDPESTDDEGFSPTPVDTVTSLRASVLGAGTALDVLTFAALRAEQAAGAAPGGAAGSAEDDLAEPVRTLEGTDPSGQTSIEDVEDALVLRAEASDGTPGGQAGAVASSTAAGDLQGLAAAACQQPGIEQWLVGGSTELGTSSRLVLQNPSRTPATVTVTLWGAGGELDLAGPSTYLVPPGSQVSTLLEGLSAEQRRIAVHVSAAGALVTSYLQHNVLDGITPHGVDLVVPGSGPGTAQVMAGVTLEESEIADEDVASVRVLVPGEEAGTASITLLGADGRHVLRGAESIDLASGAVTDVSLAGMPAGQYAVVVRADVPVVAGVQATRVGVRDEDQPGTSTPRDRAWTPSQHLPAGVPSVVSVPAGTAGSVVVTALPDALDGEHRFVDDVPVVYGDETGADGEPLVDPAAETWDAVELGELRAYGADGALLSRSSVSLAPGQTVAVDLRDLGDGTAVAAVALVPQAGTGGTDGTDGTAGTARPDALTLDWALSLGVSGIRGSTAVVVPTVPPSSQDAVLVRRSPSVGLPQD